MTDFGSGDRLVAFIERRMEELRDRQRYPRPHEDVADTDARLDELVRVLNVVQGGEV